MVNVARDRVILQRIAWNKDHFDEELLHVADETLIAVIPNSAIIEKK